MRGPGEGRPRSRRERAPLRAEPKAPTPARRPGTGCIRVLSVPTSHSCSRRDPTNKRIRRAGLVTAGVTRLPAAGGEAWPAGPARRDAGARRADAAPGDEAGARAGWREGTSAGTSSPAPAPSRASPSSSSRSGAGRSGSRDTKRGGWGRRGATAGAARPGEFRLHFRESLLARRVGKRWGRRPGGGGIAVLAGVEDPAQQSLVGAGLLGAGLGLDVSSRQPSSCAREGTCGTIA